MKSILFGNSDQMKVRGSNVNSILLAAKVQHTTVNTAFAANPVDFSKVNLKVTLQRKGKTYTIYNDVVLPGALDSCFYGGQFDQLLNIGTIGYQRIVAAAGGVDEVVLQTAEIRLHENINLKDNDELVIEVIANSSALDANSDAAASYLYFDYKEGVGVGKSIPIMRTYQIQASQSSDEVSPGNNVVGLKFINVDKAGITEANKVLQSFIVNSDKLPVSDDYYESLIKRASDFQSNADHAIRAQSFDLLQYFKNNMSGQDARLNNVVVKLSLNSSNVTASKNWVVWRAYENDQETFERAALAEAKHSAENNGQYGAWTRQLVSAIGG